MIEIKEASLRYGDGTTALKKIDLQIETGALVYIVGPSGSGKTSLLKLLIGEEYPTEGSVKVMGQFIARDQSGNIRRLRMKIGPVFQEFKLIHGRTAMENVLMGMRFLDFSPSQLNENARSALVKVGLEHKMFTMVDHLSWGECQRVAIARAVARKPALILADEPTGNLDHGNAMNILKLLNSFRDEKTTIIITTHATHLIDIKQEVKLLRLDGGSMRWERLG